MIIGNAGRCSRKIDCSLDEDEYMCDNNQTFKPSDTPNRNDKQFFVKNVEQTLRLIRFPVNANITKSGTTFSAGFMLHQSSLSTSVIEVLVYTYMTIQPPASVHRNITGTHVNFTLIE